MKNILTIFILLFTLYACNQDSTEHSDLNEDIHYTQRMEGVPVPPPPHTSEVIQVDETESMKMNVENDVNGQDSNKIEKKDYKGWPYRN